MIRGIKQLKLNGGESRIEAKDKREASDTSKKLVEEVTTGFKDLKEAMESGYTPAKHRRPSSFHYSRGIVDQGTVLINYRTLVASDLADVNPSRRGHILAAQPASWRENR